MKPSSDFISLHSDILTNTPISSYAISGVRSFQNVRIRNGNIFWKGAEFFHAGMKAHWDEGGGRILMGDNTGGEAVTMWPVTFQCGWGWISTDCLLCTYKVHHIYAVLRLAPDSNNRYRYIFWSVCPHGIVRLPLSGFSWSFTRGIFTKLCRYVPIMT